MFYVLSSWASFIKQSFSLVYYDKLTLVKSKKNLYFGKGVSHGAGLYDIMLLYISVFL